MQESGNVKHLVKKFDKNYPNHFEYDSDVPTKDTDVFQSSNGITMSKLVTPQGQDEISVTIDIGDIEDRYLKNITKSFPQTMNATQKDSGISNFSNPDKSDVFSNEINFSLSPVGMNQHFKPTQPSNLSPWLSSKISNNYAVPEAGTKLRSIGVDTFELNRIREEEIKVLKEKINDLNCKIKIKEREIETNKWIDKEMHKRLQSTSDVFAIKNQVKELQRKLDTLDKNNQDLLADNENLYEDIRKKDRMILELQSEVDNLDRIVANKKYIQENDENKRIMEDIEGIRSELMEREQQVSESQQKLSNLQRELEKKDTEITFKNMKLKESSSEKIKYDNELSMLDKKNYKLVECLNAVEMENKALKRELLRYEDFEIKWQELEDENMYLKQSIHDLEDQYKILEKQQDNSYHVNTLLDELRQALIEKNRANEERNHLYEQLRIKEAIIKEKITEENAQQQDDNQLKKFIRELEEENSLYRKFEKEVGDTEIQLRESEQERNRLESQLVQLKPKIQKLQIKSLEKDHLITQLVQELKSQAGYLPSDLRKEISKNDLGFNKASDQYNLDESNNVGAQLNSKN